MPLDSGSRGVAEVGPEPVVGGEPDVVRCRDHDIGDHVALQAGHPVGQHQLRDPAELLEALRQQSQRGGLLLVGSEPDEPVPRPGQHRAEHVHPPASDDLGAPVDGQHLTRGPHRRTPPAGAGLPDAPLTLGVGDQPSEVPVRPLIAGRPRGR